MAGGHKIWDDGFKTRIRLADSAWKAAWGTIFACAICCGIGIVKLFGTNPPLKVALAGRGIILGAGAVVFFWQSFRHASGGCDLVVNTGRSVTLPRAFGRSVDVEVPWENVVSVELEEVKKKYAKKSYYVYAPVLVFNDPSGAPRREQLHELEDKTRANDLAAWLRERLQIEVQNKPSGRSP